MYTNEYMQKRTLSVLRVGLLCLLISCTRRTLNHDSLTLENTGVMTLQTPGIIGDRPYHSLKYDTYKEFIASYIHNDKLRTYFDLDFARTFP